ncbi:ArsR/SmtB family transcription factor [Staphylococcus carnosus]|uniref:Repressor protein n=1 Tax=Staphylococcus carnosus (strain TM300) TaxID=396513 RepID=B9DMA8_STACT|nr:metalloregulator ArsR/SmtB family transcription factor [Staphylococcus carnosus]ANZ32831.1 transcriptional regulator [Staphylococcus carnosus]KOR12451.1 ArsR family transcriptional regulator [Staphylococcus carnosus]QPT04649.1 winged helix-turn-helix transcriptional regulator [Staphylococcus carnosus]UQA67374.1 metalloregulator ArsR/SmtB family transcription factor [Staphylococcus carnosus]UTB77792.1 transcriptional regulator [Staphylococcus carnosus]
MSNHELKASTLANVTDIFKSLSEPNRIRIMHLLEQGPSSVGHITHTLGLSQSNVSHQLKILRNAELVKSERQGQSKIYMLNDEHVVTLLNQAIHHAEHPAN